MRSIDVDNQVNTGYNVDRKRAKPNIASHVFFKLLSSIMEKVTLLFGF